jgi:hypothetical protein
LGVPQKNVNVDVKPNTFITIADDITKKDITYAFSFIDEDHLEYTDIAVNRSKLMEEDDCIVGYLYTYCLDSVSETSATLEKRYNFGILDAKVSLSPSSIDQGEVLVVTVEISNEGYKDAQDIKVVYHTPPSFVVESTGNFKRSSSEIDEFGLYVNNTLEWTGDVQEGESEEISFSLQGTEKLSEDSIGNGYIEFYNGTGTEKIIIEDSKYKVTTEFLELFFNYTNKSVVGEEGFFIVNLTNTLAVDTPVNFKISFPDSVDILTFDKRLKERKDGIYTLEHTINNRSTKSYDFTFKAIQHSDEPIRIYLSTEDKQNTSLTFSKPLPLNITYRGPLIRIDLGNRRLIDYTKKQTLDFIIENPLDFPYYNVSAQLSSS